MNFFQLFIKNKIKKSIDWQHKKCSILLVQFVVRLFYYYLDLNKMKLKHASVLDVVDIFLEFVETAIHNILYCCNVYPPTLFHKTQKYNCIVYMARHPDVVSYIRNVLDALRVDMEQGRMKQIGIEVNSGGVDGRRRVFHFDFTWRMGYSSKMDQEEGVVVDPQTLEAHFKQCLVQIAHLQPWKTSEPTNNDSDDDEDATFRMFVQMSDAKMRPISLTASGLPWIPMDEIESRESNHSTTFRLPIKSIDVGFANLLLTMEDESLQQ